MCKRIYLDDPNLGALEKEYLLRAIDSNFVSTAGPFVPEFEEKFAGYLGVKSCVSTQSGTAALHMTLVELGVGPGDEVILPALTFVAPANAVMYVGATPVLVDVDPGTWNISPAAIAAALTPRTKAIIPVHLYGNPCDMTAIMAIADRHGLFVIEDATESLGATLNNKFAGTFGDFGCFSFNGNKLITTGGGGMIATNRPEKAEHLKFLVNQARDASRGYFHPEVGYNYRMTNLEAALGLAQFSRLPEFLQKKRAILAAYERELAGVAGIRLQQSYPGAASAAWLSSIVVDTTELGITIGEIQAKLKERGIPTRRFFYPLGELPLYQQYTPVRCDNARRLYDNGLNLPSSTLNSMEDISFVTATVREIVQGR